MSSNSLPLVQFTKVEIYDEQISDLMRWTLNTSA